MFVLIDIGCHECGVSSEYVKSFNSKSEAKEARQKLSNRSGDWRDGGQSIPEVFEVELP